MHFVLAWLVIACFVLVASNSRSCYRPQRSCEGYVFTRVCNSVHGGVAIPACIAGGIPACLAAGLQGRGGAACSGRYLLRAGVWRPPRKQTATVADGTYPTGMHSCYYRPQRSWGKVMFLQASVILLTGGEYLTRYTPPGTRYTPPGPGTPPRDQVHPPWDQVHPPWDQVPPRDQVHPPRTRYTPPGPGTPPLGPGNPPVPPLGQVHPPGTRYPPRPGTPPRDQVPPLGPGTPPWDQVPPRDQVHPPPGPGTPPGQVHPPRDQVHPPRNQVPPPPRDQGDTVYTRAVRILLECILVDFI